MQSVPSVRSNLSECDEGSVRPRDWIYAKVSEILKTFDATGTIIGLAPYDCGTRWAVSLSVSTHVVAVTSLECAMRAICELESRINRTLDYCSVSLIIVSR